MTAEVVYQIAIHLPEKEMAKLYDMIGKNVLPYNPFKKGKRRILVSDDEAINYLLKNIFRKTTIDLK